LYWLQMMARLRPGVNRSQAQAAVALLFEQWVAATATNDKERANLPSLVCYLEARGWTAFASDIRSRCFYCWRWWA